MAERWRFSAMVASDEADSGDVSPSEEDESAFAIVLQGLQNYA